MTYSELVQTNKANQLRLWLKGNAKKLNGDLDESQLPWICLAKETTNSFDVSIYRKFAENVYIHIQYFERVRHNLM